MKIFGHKQDQPQQQASTAIPKPSAEHPAASPMVHSILHLQRKIGNQAVQRLFHVNDEASEADSDTSATTRSAHDSSRISASSKAPESFQAKLSVTTPGDIYEHEADRVSEQVISLTEPQLQHACACGGECPKCQTEQLDHAQGRLLTKPAESGDLGQDAAPPIVNEVLSSSGQPLDRATRGFMESRFGHDFSRVRVHSDSTAAAAVNAVKAKAFTVGNDIVFGVGQYSPASGEGGHLLAHELTHVIQQTGGNVVMQRQHNLGGALAPEDERLAEIIDNNPSWEIRPGRGNYHNLRRLQQMVEQNATDSDRTQPGADFYADPVFIAFYLHGARGIFRLYPNNRQMQLGSLTWLAAHLTPEGRERAELQIALLSLVMGVVEARAALRVPPAPGSAAPRPSRDIQQSPPQQAANRPTGGAQTASETAPQRGPTGATAPPTGTTPQLPTPQRPPATTTAGQLTTAPPRQAPPTGGASRTGAQGGSQPVPPRNAFREDVERQSANPQGTRGRTPASGSPTAQVSAGGGTAGVGGRGRTPEQPSQLTMGGGRRRQGGQGRGEGGREEREEREEGSTRRPTRQRGRRQPPVPNTNPESENLEQPRPQTPPRQQSPAQEDIYEGANGLRDAFQVVGDNLGRGRVTTVSWEPRGIIGGVGDPSHRAALSRQGYDPNTFRFRQYMVRYRFDDGQPGEYIVDVFSDGVRYYFPHVCSRN